MIHKFTLLLALCLVTFQVSASPECDIVSNDNISVFDAAWNNNAQSTYQEAQNGLMYFAN